MNKFITLLVLTAIFLACALFLQPLWAAVITIGETNILTGYDSRKRKLLIARPVSLSQTATMQLFQDDAVADGLGGHQA
jgi:hypothetical protein